VDELNRFQDPLAPISRNTLHVLVGVLGGMTFVTVASISLKWALLLIPGVVVTVLILLRPDVGLLLTVGTIPLEQMGALGFLSPALYMSVSKVLGMLTLVSWFLHLVLKKRRFHYDRQYLILGGYLLVALLSLATAWDLRVGVRSFIRVLVSVGFYVLVINMITSRAFFRKVILIFLLAYVAVGCFTLVQRYLPAYRIGQKMSAVKMGVLKDVTEKELAHGMVLRSSGTSFHPLGLALNVVVVFPFLVYLFETMHGPKKLFWGISILVEFTALIFTYARTGFVVWVFVVFLLALYRILKINPVRLAVFLMIVLLSYPLIPSHYRDRVLRLHSYELKNSTSLTNRLRIQKKALEMFPETGFLGVGIGNQPLSRIVFGEVDESVPSGTHNMFLEVMFQMGVFGLCFLLLFLYFTFRDFKAADENYRKSGNLPDLQYATVLKISYLGILAYSLFYEINNASAKNCWLILALAVVIKRLSEQALREQDAERPVKMVRS